MKIDKNDKQYINNFVKDSLEVFSQNGYLMDEDLKQYIMNVINLERKNKEYLSEIIFKKILKTENYNQILNNQVKMCTCCKNILPDLDFYERRGECKTCTYRKYKEYYRNNKEKKYKYNKKTYEKIMSDPEKHQQYLKIKRKNRNKHKEKYQASSRRWKLKKYLIEKLDRDISLEELEKAFNLKEAEKIGNKKVYEIMFSYKKVC